LADDDAVGPVNNFLHSLFSLVDVFLNGILVTSSSNTYPYRTYIENLLSYGPAAKRSQLTVSLFYKDAAGKMDKVNPLAENADERNSGFIRRAAFTAQSRELNLMDRIHADIFFQSRYILNEVNVKIKLTRNRDVFCLMSTGDHAFKVKITAAAMIIRKVKISPSVYLAHAKTLDMGLAKYLFRQVVLQSFYDSSRLPGCESREII
jgi:hypothetical protein